jgi:hypothetical protein
MKTTRTLLAAGLALALGACATGPNVRTNVDTSVDFGSYRTYGFVEQPGTDRGEYATLVTRALKAGVSAEMERRGYHPSETPDLLINFQGHAEDKQEAANVLVGAGFHHGFGFGGRFGGDVSCWRDVRDVTQGTLNIDIVDRVRKVSVWEGTLVRELSSNEKDDLVKSLPAIATSVLKAYPYVAGQSAPVGAAKTR